MPVKIDIDPGPLGPGKTRAYSVYGHEPIAVEVKCFVIHPPPPSFRGCPACGSRQMHDGERGQLVVPFDFLQGNISISATDAAGSRAFAEIEIATTDQGESAEGELAF